MRVNDITIFLDKGDEVEIVARTNKAPVYPITLRIKKAYDFEPAITMFMNETQLINLANAIYAAKGVCYDKA